MVIESQSLRSQEADYAINSASKTRVKKSKHGLRGEKFIARRLRASEKFKKVIHASQNDSRLGYDIETIDHDGKKVFHEIKSSGKENFAPSIWYIAKKQFDIARSNVEKYFFWFVNAVNSKNPSILKFRPDQLKFKAGRYQVQVGSKPAYRMHFQAKKLFRELEDFITGTLTSQRKDRSLMEEKRLVAMSVLTKQLLAQRLNSNPRRQGINNVEVNLKQASNSKPFHLKYTDSERKEVLVDIKVTEKQPRDNANLKFYISRKRREAAMRLSPSSKIKREFWHCILNPNKESLDLEVYDISGKRFWNDPDNHSSIDYYSFKVL